MIVGRGDIAKVLRDREDRVYFASGVSNSQESRESEYQREKALLLSQDYLRHIVYFSSLCVFYSDSRYAHHKREMEELIRNLFRKYTIVRLGNITWGSNPHTLINYLKAHNDAEIRNVWRYIVTRDEFTHWMEMIPEWNCEMNITGRRMKVKDIVEEYVEWGK